MALTTLPAGRSSFRPSAASAREPESSKHRTTCSRDPATRAFDLGRIAARLRVKTTRGDYWIPTLARKVSLGRNDDPVICIKPAKTGAVIVVSVLRVPLSKTAVMDVIRNPTRTHRFRFYGVAGGP